MDGVIANEDVQVLQVTENRNFIERAKDWYNQKRNDYIENYINNGKAQEIEQKIDDNAEKFKDGVRTVSAVAGDIASFVSPESAFGKICSNIASPAICKLADLAAKIQKKVIIGGKRFIEKHFLHVDGTNQNIDAYNFDDGITEPQIDIGNLKDSYEEVANLGWGK